MQADLEAFRAALRAPPSYRKESASEAPLVNPIPVGFGNSTLNRRPATACLDCDGVRSEIG
jgi:hypothetical protein